MRQSRTWTGLRRREQNRMRQTSVCERRVGSVGTGNIEKLLALKFWHVSGRSTDDFPQLI